MTKRFAKNSLETACDGRSRLIDHTTRTFSLKRYVANKVAVTNRGLLLPFMFCARVDAPTSDMDDIVPETRA